MDENYFPIPKPERLPAHISPCPIVEAVLEVRYQPTKAWEVVPGMVYSLIAGKYPRTETLPINDLPAKIRETQKPLEFAPAVRFHAEDFMVQLGPKVLALNVKGPYKQWAEFRSEMKWLWETVMPLGIFGEGVRLGLRYINFFDLERFKTGVLQHLRMGVTMENERLLPPEISLTMNVMRDKFGGKIQIHDSARRAQGDKLLDGSALDIDIFLSGAYFTFDEDILECFDTAHAMEKEIFFGLLKEDFLSSLNPKS